MNLEKLFRQALLEDPAVAALVGGSSDEARVHPDALPQGSPLPAIVYHQEDGFQDAVLEPGAGVETRRFGLDLHAANREAVRALAAAVKACLEAALPAAEGLQVQGMFLMSALSRYDGETRTYVVESDWDVKFSGPESGS